MSTFTSNITIVNNSNATLYLDTAHSSGISMSWPSTLSYTPGENSYQFNQGFDWQINFTAFYTANNGASIALSFYADGVTEFSETIVPNPSNAFTGSTGSYTDHYNPTFTIAGTAVSPGA